MLYNPIQYPSLSYIISGKRTRCRFPTLLKGCVTRSLVEESMYEDEDRVKLYNMKGVQW